MTSLRWYALAAAALIASRAAAQPSRPPNHDFGISVAAAHSFHDSYTTATYHDQPGIVGGNGIGFAAGLVGRWWLSWGNKGPALVAHLEYQSMPASFEHATSSSGFVSSGFVADSAAVDARGRHVADVSYGMVAANILLQYPVIWLRSGGVIDLEAGPSVGYVVREGWEEIYTVDEPKSVYPRNGHVDRVLDNGQAVLLRTGSIPELSRWRVGLRAGIGMELRAGHFNLHPSLILDYGLTPVTKGSSWKAHALRFGLDIVPNASFWYSLQDHDEDEDSPL